MSSASRAEPSRGSDRLVLVVEDEPVLRASIVRGLSKLRGVDVIDAGTVRDARALLSAHPPRFVICDLDLPDGSGIDVATELDRRGLRVPIAFVSAYVGEFRTKLPRRAEIDVLEKPVSLERLRALVEQHLGEGRDEPSPFGVADYVQLAGMSRRSVVLEIHGRKKGTIVVRAGEVWSAVDDRGQGMDAFRRLAFAADAEVHTRSLGSGELPDRNVEGLAEGVLLEAARLLDEEDRAAKAGDRDEGFDDAWSVEEPEADPPRTAALAFAELYEEGVDALLGKRFEEAYEAFLAASRIRGDDPHVVANLNRLREMGYGS